MDADTKRNIIWKLFFFDDEPPFPTDISLGDYDGYFTLFEDQTRNCDSGDVLAAIAIMKSDITVTRNDVWQKLQESRNLPPTPEILHDAIDGAVRVWLMINSRRTGEITMADLSVARTWPAAQKLCDFLYGIFYPGGSPPVPPATHYSAEELSDMAKESAEVQTRLTHPLTAVNLSRYPKIHIHWTSYISEHLQFEHNFKDLIVFEQKAWLTATVRLLKEWERRRDAAAKAARDAAAKAAQDAAAKAARDAPANAPAGGEFPLPPFPIPIEVLQEALRSLDYLFPPGEKPTRELLKKYGRDFDEMTRQPGPKPRLKDFLYYHDRLIEIGQEFLNPPRDLRTVWSDTRNPIQFWTFWLGLIIVFMTLAFGIIGSVLAGLQYNVARYPPPETSSMSNITKVERMDGTGFSQ